MWITATRSLASLAAGAAALYVIKKRLRSSGASRRRELIPISEERVLVIGASSGVGKEIALQYARRGARIALVGRRAEDLERVSQECFVVSPHRGSSAGAELAEEYTQRQGKTDKFWGFTPMGSAKFDTGCFYVAADCSDPNAICRVKTCVEESMLFPTFG